ncbi:MAG TPA: hypothetical protein VFB90_07890 [Dehalococcoidia bacterium]|nr:hypothetical protein [Dehalococcoidia bacterium]
MSLVFGLGMAAFLAIEPTQEWLLLLLSGLVALGAEGIIRTHPQSRDFELDDVVLHIFAPTVFTIVIGLFLEDFATGYAAVPAGVLMAIPFGAILNAEYHSINHRSPLYHAAHLMLNTTAYVTAFLFFVTVYDFEISLSKTVAAVGIVSFILAIEILREETYDLGQLLVFSAVVGLLAAQTAVAIYFLPFTGGASAVFLLLGFYSITGILHHYLIDDTGLPTIAEFAAISLAGLGMIAASRSFL